jgi:hypothetical protein
VIKNRKIVARYVRRKRERIYSISGNVHLFTTDFDTRTKKPPQAKDWHIFHVTLRRRSLDDDQGRVHTRRDERGADLAKGLRDLGRHGRAVFLRELEQLLLVRIDRHAPRTSDDDDEWPRARAARRSHARELEHTLQGLRGGRLLEGNATEGRSEVGAARCMRGVAAPGNIVRRLRLHTRHRVLRVDRVGVRCGLGSQR